MTTRAEKAEAKLAVVDSMLLEIWVAYNRIGDALKMVKREHTERIICPSCHKEQVATVEHTWPFYSYVHFCECGYTIMESEWEKVKE